jgi:hypothetical protein
MYDQHFLCAAWPEGEAPGIRLGMDLSLESWRQQYGVLQEDRHADGGNQRDQTVAALRRGVGNPFDTVAIGTGDDDRDEGSGHQQRQRMDTHHGQPGKGDEGHVGTDHVHLAVGEVDHANDAVNHRVADGDQGIGAADGQSINQLLEEMIDLRHYSAPKNLIRISLVESFPARPWSYPRIGFASEPLVTVLRFSGEEPGSRGGPIPRKTKPTARTVGLLTQSRSLLRETSVFGLPKCHS